MNVSVGKSVFIDSYRQTQNEDTEANFSESDEDQERVVYNSNEYYGSLN